LKSKHNYIFFFFLTGLFISCTSLYAQETITVEGIVYDNDTKLALPQLMVINAKTGLGMFADAEGKFSVKISKTDTLAFSCVGYHLKKVSLNDSAAKQKYYLTIQMNKLQYTLKEISVFANRSLNEIDKDIAKLDSTSAYASFKDVNGLESPITYLYMRFSKFGKSKTLVAELENEDLKKQILKDLFRLYIKYEIIELNEEEFDAFIKYCNLSEEFIKTASQFELVTAIKAKYESFRLRWK